MVTRSVNLYLQLRLSSARFEKFQRQIEGPIAFDSTPKMGASVLIRREEKLFFWRRSANRGCITNLESREVRHAPTLLSWPFDLDSQRKDPLKKNMIHVGQILIICTPDYTRTPEHVPMLYAAGETIFVLCAVVAHVSAWHNPGLSNHRHVRIRHQLCNHSYGLVRGHTNPFILKKASANPLSSVWASMTLYALTSASFL